ncbi:hypothetical protein FIBSPDRAFT_263554 [Athelia psychrophila]|uniref:Uncharacterized protein n=1 Tax=Athelia psychrophila TaxID=1759441 RepID=A0A165XC65_9AGAM|nr:hypothetical protein FIBSPDRAFT_263554 [Fibularhizoctonia sp. CBS 109695]
MTSTYTATMAQRSPPLALSTSTSPFTSENLARARARLEFQFCSRGVSVKHASYQGDSHQTDVINNFFVAAKAGGWAGAFYWNLGFSGSQPGVCGTDSTIKYTLYNCEGAERSGYDAFKSS